jgi:hypothetical protein
MELRNMAFLFRAKLLVSVPCVSPIIPAFFDLIASALAPKSKRAYTSITVHQPIPSRSTFFQAVTFKFHRPDLKDLVTFWFVVFAVRVRASNDPAEPSDGRVASKECWLDVPIS